MSGGQQINVGQGTVIGGPGAATTGQAATVSAGTLGDGLSVRLISRKVGGGTGTQALSGLANAMAMGLVSPGYSKALTGQASTGAQGGFTKSRTAALLGSSSTTQTGFVSSTGSGSSLTWQFADGATLFPTSSHSLTLATGVPLGANIYYPSPDLLPGQTLQVASGTLLLTSDSTLPATDSDRDVVIEVMDSPVATIVNVSKSITYGATGWTVAPDSSYGTGRWGRVMYDCSHGDIIEISPGYVHQSAADASASINASAAGMLCVSKICTIRNMTGRGRWRIWNGTEFGSFFLSANWGGIGILSRTAMSSARGDFTIEGFEVDNYGDSYGLHIFGGSETDPDWTNMHNSLTLRNFKLGKPSGSSSSGVGGAAQTMTLEDGHVYDSGDGSGLEHNLYITSDTMTLRGLRLSRSRGWTGTPFEAGSASTLDGHLAKVSAINATVEGCSFDCSATSDPSEMLQMKAGGNWTVRGNLFVDSQYSQVASGAITMLREYAGDGVTPNHQPFSGRDGNSLLFEKNVFVGHFPRPIIWFLDPATNPLAAIHASTDSTVAADRRLQSLIVRDNIAMVCTAGASAVVDSFRISGWAAQASTKPLWIYRDPNAGAAWQTRGNTVMTYDVTEAAFNDRLIKGYTLVAGPVTANAGSVTTKRFQWPHGYVARTDAYQGLG